MRTYLLLLALFGFTGVRAAVYTVTSPLDDGSPGTLRWAIQQANASPAADTIIFSIPAAAPLNRRTIALNSELPPLGSNLVIDGTTQLAPPIGTSDARILIIPRSYDLCNRGLRIEEASNIEIYGMAFAGFINNPPTAPADYRDAIYMLNARNITIGAPNMGNAFTACFYAIRHQAVSSRGNPPPAWCANITIQSNKIGRNPNAGGPGGGAQGSGVVNGIVLDGANNVTIGGWAQAEGNEFLTFLNAISIFTDLRNLADDKHIRVVKNTIQPGIRPTAIPFVLPNSGITIRNKVPAAQMPYEVVVSGNKLSNTFISLAGFQRNMQVVNNDIDCLADPAEVHSATGIGILSCDSAMVGGTDSVNTVRNAAANAIALTSTSYVTVSKNVIVCSGLQGINVVTGTVTVPQITEMTASPLLNAVQGKSCPGCNVEVFRTNECTNFVYNGKQYQTTVTADANGDWQYNGTVNCNTTFTTTNPAGTTSRFYAFQDFIFNASNAIVRNASCGRSNGSITGIKIFAEVDFYWADAAGNVVGRDTNLINVPPGTYTLVGTKQNVLCSREISFTIGDIQPEIDESLLRITNPAPGCNIRGSITGLLVTGAPLAALRLQWFDQNGVQVGTGLSLTNLAAGSYTLRVSVISDPSCFVTAGPYVLTNTVSPSFDLSGITITDATCGSSNGSITGIVIIDPTSPQSFTWTNSLGVTVATTPSLTNVPPGKYQLQYNDASPCPAITTPTFTIGNNGLVTIDVSAAVVEPSGCTVVKGAVKNVLVTGADIVEWINLTTGAVAAAGTTLLNVPAGSYRIRAFDTTYRCADSADFTIGTTPITQLTVAAKTVRDETCTAANGFIGNIQFSTAVTGYTFQWVRNTTDTFSTALSISGLAAGNYELIAYDSNGCVQSVLQQRINDNPSPVLDESSIQITNDVCTRQLGSIKNLVASGGTTPLSYSWFSSPSGSLVSSSQNIAQLLKGDYYMIVTDANGCRDTSTTLFVDDESPVIPPPQYEELYVKRNTSGRFTLLDPANAGSYEFFNDAAGSTPFLSNANGAFTTPVLSADRDYYVRRVVGSCKSLRTKVHINVIDFSKVFVPNAFTPNGDGLNDQLRIRVYGKIIIDQFVVYNRWGTPVFLGGEVSKAWDGTWKGQPQPAGNYIWTIQGYDIDGTPINLKGTVMIIR